MRRLIFLLPVLLFGCPPQKSVLSDYSIPEVTEQMVLVITPDDDATDGELARYERSRGGVWQAVGDTHPVTVGRSGLAWGKGLCTTPKGVEKKEGDGKAPAGVFQLTEVFGYEIPLDLTLNMPFTPATELLECVDDSNSKFYNQLVDSLNMKKDWTSSEFMRRQDHQYRWGVVVAHNSDAVSMGGSCIFLHIWKEPGAPTSGCTAMAEQDLLKTIYWLDKSKNPVLVQLTRQAFSEWTAIIGSMDF